MAQKDKFVEYEATIRSLYSDQDEEFFVRTMLEIREQIALESEQRQNQKLGHALLELFSKQYIRRTAMAIMVMQVGILSGSLAIQNYQGLLYASLGFTGRRAILISGFYGFMGIIGQVINLLGVSDKWSRKRTMCKFLPYSFSHRADDHRARLFDFSGHALHSHGPLTLLRRRPQ